MAGQDELAELLKAQAERRIANKNRPPHDNSTDYAGSMMTFQCVGCGDDIYVSEDYTPPRRTRCRPCEDIAYLQKNK